MTKLSEQNNSGSESKELKSNPLITGPKAVLAAGILAVATTSVADTTKLQVKSLIEQCDFNGDGKVTTKKTWKTDGVSKKDAKKENSCKIDYENNIIKQDIAYKKQDIAYKKQDIAYKKQDIAYKKQDIAELDKKLLTLLAELSEKDLLKLIREKELEIKNEKDPKKIKAMKESLKIFKEQYNKRINQKTA